MTWSNHVPLWNPYNPSSMLRRSDTASTMKRAGMCTRGVSSLCIVPCPHSLYLRQVPWGHARLSRQQSPRDQ